MKTTPHDGPLKPQSKVTVLLAVGIAIAIGAAAGLGGFIGELKTARAANAPAEPISAAQDFQRKAQFYLDFVEAENSTGFHAPQEALRILGESINFSRKGQLALRPAK
jgi:nitrite reductase (cytochrome c-552)